MRTIIKSALVVLCATLWLLFKEACALADSLPSDWILNLPGRSLLLLRPSSYSVG